MWRACRSRNAMGSCTVDFWLWQTSTEPEVEFSPSRWEFMQDRPMVPMGRPTFGPNPPQGIGVWCEAKIFKCESWPTLSTLHLYPPRIWYPTPHPSRVPSWISTLTLYDFIEMVLVKPSRAWKLSSCINFFLGLPLPSRRIQNIGRPHDPLWPVHILKFDSFHANRSWFSLRVLC